MTYMLSSTLRNNDSSNTTILIVILVCSFTGFLFLALILTFLLRYHLQFKILIFNLFVVSSRRRISIAYLKLPCIHSSSATKDSQDDSPLSHSPIHGKFQLRLDEHHEKLRARERELRYTDLVNIHL